MRNEREEAREMVQFIENGIREARAGGVPEEEIQAVYEYLEYFRQVRDAPPPQRPRKPTAAELEMAAFVQQMMDRQGTIMPDFDALYKRKSEIDNRVDGEPLP